MTGVLTRFRKDPIGFVANIEVIFYQVPLSISQRNYLPMVANDLRQFCVKGGFCFTKFCSNSRVMLQSTPEEERSKELKNLDLQPERLPLERAFGFYWNIESDDFEFCLTSNSKRSTRREILLVVSSVFDPFGFVAPFILPAKKILQELCLEKELDWDHKIPIAYQNIWSKWRNDLHILERHLIKRSVIPPEFGKIVFSFMCFTMRVLLGMVQ